MSLEQDIANVVSAAEQLTGIVDTKIEDINNTVNGKVAEMNSQVAVKKNEIDTAITQQVQRVDTALENKQVIGNGGHGTKSIGIASFFTGETGATYMHLKLPYKIDTHNCMFHLNIYGYEYGKNNIVDATFTGYCYTNQNKLYQSKTAGTHEPIVYVGTDQHVYLRITLESQYYLTLSVDSTYVGNGSVLKPGDVQFISSTEAQL
ncbi:hypothetical protein [Pseudoalteromonas luteoviolacea]|uniref:Uncharacterized protein n=1 Tax=Pseudoalteromonas luteoviolacea S4054 TaxID=1129367 RepID=A0A0F6AHA0_9GAMM|nr:hypothetical protein [Pseudoalteromonas luteoviolacea]KKE85171.1 hypothetical protein N479_26240 [Pseudoalteromonas luteoviolacea S4054]AOT09367.1 hypothetical protein S4054249_16590 [Pseudoalteromonas luteoviolacea]AOT14279.1 hypothetical protein S40542_16560 [Pseudoalteromonas luteoviolacea]AOT19195.1 hypothetical protein S4054_16565 [Pseudoalteromonas luteoviolacea]KZN73467.1 hypothetical protein N481_12160 [Pseudoalteromonas luteoviolacea S4047-1]